jgi:hypothetical protein
MTADVSRIGNTYGNYLNSAYVSDPDTFGLNPLGANNGMNSVFSPYSTDFSGMGGFGGYPSIGGYGCGYPSTGNPETDMKMQERMMEKQMDFEHRMQEKQKAYALKDQKDDRALQYQATASDANLNQCLANMNAAAKENEQDAFYAALNKARQALRQQLQQGGITGSNAAELDAQISNLYTQQFGTTITDDLDKNGSSAFMKGVKDPFGILSAVGIADKRSTADNITEVAHSEKSKADGFWQGVGQYGTIPILGVAIGLLKGLKKA